MKIRSRRLCALTALLGMAGGTGITSAQIHAQTLDTKEQVATESHGRARGSDALARLVTVDLERVTLKAAVKAIATTAGVRVQYQSALLEAVAEPISLRAQNQSLGMVLDRVLRGTKLRVLALDPDLVAIVPDESTAVQQEAVVGTVRNGKTRQPVARATIFIDDAAKGISADDQGGFRLAVSAGRHRLSVRAVGFTKETRTITVAAGQATTLEILLSPSASVLDEVIVTGTVVATERKAIPNPITVITADDIAKRGISRIDQLFRGEVPGVLALDLGSAMYAASQPGKLATSRVYARGASTDAGGATPLKTYIDGVELLNSSYLGTIDPKSIERIEIITGPQAATIYGSGAMGGVMQIFTKKGNGSTADLTASFRYGVIENNLRPNLAAAHDEAVDVRGGTGPDLSYTASLTNSYTGPWQPRLFSQFTGISAGLNHTRGPVTIGASFSGSIGRNGTYIDIIDNVVWDDLGPVSAALMETGEWIARPTYRAASQVTSRTSSQMGAMNLDYRQASFLQHHVTAGVSQNRFVKDPIAPTYMRISDTSMTVGILSGRRTTLGYNGTFAPMLPGAVSSSLTVGATGSFGYETQTDGCLQSATGPLWISCAAQPLAIDNRDAPGGWGGFGQWRIGFFQRLYITLGLRGERNPTYGTAHKIDWTPTNGATYTAEIGELTLKVLGSYGRATRAPTASMQQEWTVRDPNAEPSEYVYSRSNPELVPEVSRGPQGGLELYYGNLGSLTVNRYKQKVSDLIRNIKVDSILLYYPALSDWQSRDVFQYVNTATVLQQGWETTGSLTLGAILLKGTYSWTDSHVLSNGRNPWPVYETEQSFRYVPSHMGNVTASYARGGTSLTLAVNYVGQTLRNVCDDATAMLVCVGSGNARLKQYVVRRNIVTAYGTRPGYYRSDLTASQYLTSWASLSLVVNNLGNGYGSEATYVTPTKGRQTTVGMSLRYPLQRQ